MEYWIILERTTMLMLAIILAILSSSYAVSSIQPNAGSSVSPRLIKCYNDSTLLEKDYRLPATIETLIALIRKIEDNTPYSSNREIASQLLQSFRQDGIVRSKKGNLPSSYGIPYSPKEWNSYRNIVLLKRVIPNENELDISMLTDIEQCSFHFLLSKSVEYDRRGDENIVCSQLGKYRIRQRRNTFAREQVELFNTDQGTASQCPVELGVVNSKWGAVSAGSLFSGIASGFNSQSIPINNSHSLDSRFAATIVGDLAEVALYQISRTRGNEVEVGAEGSWNCTLEPKWYFVKKNQLLQLTDAEIRGGLDGLYLALSMDEIKKNYRDIKLSQIVDLYYSSRGVFNNTLRACNRKILETSFTTTDKLIEQTSYFETLLDPVATLDSSIDPQKYRELAELAVKTFNNYLPENLNDPSCSEENTTISRISSDLIIFMDLTFEYRRIQPIISYLLDNIDVNRYQTKYTVLNAKNCQVMMNSSTTILDFHQMFNESVRESAPQGIDFGLTMDTIETVFISKLNNKTNAGGSSTIFLIVTQSTPSEEQKTYASSKLENLKKSYPADLRTLILGVGQRETYRNYVINPDTDIFMLPDTSTSNLIGSEAALKTKMKELVERFRELPRNVINPNCGTNFTELGDKSTLNLVQYVEPTGVNLYKISPNYFFSHADGATLRIKGQGFGSMNVCITRLLTSFSTANNSLQCKTINSDEYSQNIDDYCKDKSFSECEPVYIYVAGGTSYYRCTDSNCRFPDEMKFIISLENVGCTNSAVKFEFSIFSIITLILSISTIVYH